MVTIYRTCHLTTEKIICIFKSFCVNLLENSSWSVVIFFPPCLRGLWIWNPGEELLTICWFSLKILSYNFLVTVLFNSSWPCVILIGLNQGLANIINEGLLKALCLHYWHLVSPCTARKQKHFKRAYSKNYSLNNCRIWGQFGKGIRKIKTKIILWRDRMNMIILSYFYFTHC